jgi:Bifunctional DNA primase/polymerase, N-terminal
VAQPRCADGAAARPTGGGEVRQGEVAAGGPRPWEGAHRETDVNGTGARGRGRLPASPVRVARTLRLLVDEWGWPVVPGAFADGGVCSCADPSCPEPGRHALADASWLAATSDAERVRDRWRAHPEAAIVLPVGWCFDLLEVPEWGGREAIGRLEAQGHRLPPVIATATGRLLFLVSALDRNAGELAETGSGTPAPGPAATLRSAATPRTAASGGRAEPDAAGRELAGQEVSGRDVSGRDVSGREEAARDAAAAREAVTELEPWPTSSTWLASAAGCRPETSIWVGGGVPDAPDVIVRRSGLLVAPLLGPEPPGVTRWLVPPTARRTALPRMEDVLGPIVHACREAALRPVPGMSAGPEAVPRRADSAARRP